jgi:hypothetical protein
MPRVSTITTLESMLASKPMAMTTAISTQRILFILGSA